jgi:hypothetical protein
VVNVGRALVLFFVALVGVAACGTDGDVGSPGTHLTVDGIATTGVGLIQPGTGADTGSGTDPDAVVPSAADPDDAARIPFSGSVTCDGANSTGDGMFAVTAIGVCGQIENAATSLEAAGRSDDQACAQIYGGPQHVTIKGSVDGALVDVSIDRSDGCGIDDWQRVEWLIGPPER